MDLQALEKNSAVRVFLVVFIVAAQTLVLWKGIIPGWQHLDSDFPNYYTASLLLLEGEEVADFYDNAWFEAQARQRGIDASARFTPFPPVTAILAIPVTFFEPLTAKRIWLVLNVLLLFVLVVQLRSITRLSYLWVSVLASIALLPIISNFRMGQFYLLLLCGLLACYQWAIRGQYLRSGIVLAFLALVKYFPVSTIAGFALAGKRKVWWSAGIALVIMVIAQAWLFGWEAWERYMDILLGHLGGRIPEHGQFVPAYQSMDSFLTHLFVSDASNPYAITNAPGLKAAIKWTIYLFVGGSLAWAWWNFRKSDKDDFMGATLALTSLAALLLLPASATYHFLLLLFPIALLYRLGRTGMTLRDGLPILTLMFIAANTSSFTIPWKTGVHTLDLFLMYPRLWAMSLLYIYGYWWLMRFKKERA